MFSLRFDTGNAAFADGCGPTEAARILRHAANLAENGNVRGVLHDVNGNRIGEWSAEYTADETDEGEE